MNIYTFSIQKILQIFEKIFLKILIFAGFLQKISAKNACFSQSFTKIKSKSSNTFILSAAGKSLKNRCDFVPFFVE